MLPSLIMLSLWFSLLGVSLARHGKSVTKKENFFVTLFAVVLNASILLWGGFFNPLIDAIKGGG